MDSTSNGLPQPPALQPQNQTTTYKIFTGPQGLRAGWRLLIYVAAFVALLILFTAIIQAFTGRTKSHDLPMLWGFLIGECISFIAAVIPAIVLARFEKRPFGAYGLPLRMAFGWNFWKGIAWGFISISALLVTMRGMGVFYYGALALHGVTILKYAAFWGVLFVFVGLAEDFAFRGYTQFTLADGIGFWPAAVVLSLLFGGVHLHQELALGDARRAVAGVLAAAFIGLFFCFTLRRTGTLWFAIGLHASWDWGQTFFYSVPDSGTVAPGHLLSSSFQGNPWLSGGVVGPEGSILVFLVIALLWVLFNWFHPARRQDVPTFEGDAEPTFSP